MRLGRLACAVLLLPAQPVSPGSGQPPTIELDTGPCARPATRPWICARIFDDGTITKVRALFRARGSEPFYWTEMRFEGSRYCASLPLPSKKTRAIDFYVEAVDDEYELSRSRDQQLEIDAGCKVEPAPEPEGPACVGTTTAHQPDKPAGFEASSSTSGCG